ncbi:MAG: N-acetyltransferase [Peptostreptococcaceae bacterium]|nr:N-acetyltransferase [Peptostreptococcaceae bacterium]
MIRKIEVSELTKFGERIKEIYMKSLGYSHEAADFLLTRIRKSEENDLHPIILGSFDKEEPVGFIFGFDFHPDNWWAGQIDGRLPKDHDWYEDTFELNELEILPSHQKQGRGRRLLEALFEQMPHKQALLGTAKENNEHVIRLYESLGFEIVIDSFRYEGDIYGNSLIMGWQRDRG